MPELFTMAFRRRDWQRITAESSLIAPPAPDNLPVKELNWTKLKTVVLPDSSHTPYLKLNKFLPAAENRWWMSQPWGSCRPRTGCCEFLSTTAWCGHTSACGRHAVSWTYAAVRWSTGPPGRKQSSIELTGVWDDRIIVAKVLKVLHSQRNAWLDPNGHQTPVHYTPFRTVGNTGTSSKATLRKNLRNGAEST